MFRHTPSVVLGPEEGRWHLEESLDGGSDRGVRPPFPGADLRDKGVGDAGLLGQVSQSRWLPNEITERESPLHTHLRSPLACRMVFHVAEHTTTRGQQEAERNPERITRPQASAFIRVPATVASVSVEVRNGRLTPTSPGVSDVERLALVGQEFLRFRGLWTEDDVASFGKEFGSLRITPIADIHWVRVLTESPHGAINGPVQDWIRLSGLMDYAVGLLELLQNDTRRQDILETLESLGGIVRPMDWAMLRDDYPEDPWIAGVLGGLARMGLLARLVGDSLTLEGTAALRDPEQPDRRWEQMHTLTLTPEGIAQALRRTVSPWLHKVLPELWVVGARLVPGYSTRDDLLTAMWLQLVNAITEGKPLKVCAFAGCPGPPTRPHVFLWRWGASRHREDTIYCHPACANAASVRRSRAREKGE